MRIRPIARDDLDGLQALAQQPASSPLVSSSSTRK